MARVRTTQQCSINNLTQLNRSGSPDDERFTKYYHHQSFAVCPYRGEVQSVNLEKMHVQGQLQTGNHSLPDSRLMNDVTKFSCKGGLSCFSTIILIFVEPSKRQVFLCQVRGENPTFLRYTARTEVTFRAKELCR